EQAWVGIKEDRPGGDDAIRPAFPDHPAGLGHSGWETFRLHQQLIGLRHRHPWLHRARTRVLHLTNRQLAYETAAGDARLVVALNIDDAPATVEVGAGMVGKGGSDAATVELAPHSWVVLGD
ncbi:MAG TPA: DUF3459 domain-containing protein, partial [Acidimicrobiales bacterium]|nr:DUF3459 domain-containing protein [Acidimicrobiales bacterium]